MADGIVLGAGAGNYIIWLAFVIVFAGAVEIIPVYLILKRITRQDIRLLVPAIVLVLCFIPMMQFDLDLLVLASFLVIGPVAALIPNCVVPERTPPGSRFARVVICYIAVTLFGNAAGPAPGQGKNEFVFFVLRPRSGRPICPLRHPGPRHYFPKYSATFLRCSRIGRLWGHFSSHSPHSSQTEA